MRYYSTITRQTQINRKKSIPMSLMKFMNKTFEFVEHNYERTRERDRDEENFFKSKFFI